MLLMGNLTARQKLLGGVLAVAAGITTIGGAYVMARELNPFMMKDDHEDSLEDLNATLSGISGSLDEMLRGICRNTLQRIRSQADAARVSAESEERKTPPDYTVITALRRSHSTFLEQYEFERQQCGFIKLSTSQAE